MTLKEAIERNREREKAKRDQWESKRAAILAERQAKWDAEDRERVVAMTPNPPLTGG